jgi:hypothetical protein
VLVKKMFRVPDMATEFAVSALWRLGRAADVGAAAFGHLDGISPVRFSYI